MYKWMSLLLLCFLFACSSAQESEASMDAEQKEANASEQTQEKESLRETYDSQKINASSTAETTDKTAITPKTVIIPAINVEANIEKVGRYTNGQMGEPESVDGVGWYKDGYQPGAKGSAVLAGHVDSRTGPAVFYNLEDLQEGDEIIVTDEEGTEQTFIVQKSEAYDRKNAPLNKIFGFSYRRQLNLITCTGEFNKEAGTHDERLVVYAVHEDDVNPAG
ncbi:class F sortase [Halobacillus sp. Nhm2S1]|uniref:class F sortase n=1 Tax=Halobacillus sp. Nhm2S1 TaxID=2866716 RepID=UPI001C72CA54|nr:class F sortase [Halobacillus sp. Nhm2S1]MBX0358557.1 class F sortase [Halobacillus sp. Nhm2S1]